MALSFFGDVVFARNELTLKFNATVQAFHKDPEGGQWKKVVSKDFRGLGGLQFQLKKKVTYRIIFSVKKPKDLKAVFKARMLGRKDGIVVAPEEEKAQIIFGSQPGCQVATDRCKPLGMSDVGNVELRLEVEKAKAASFGILLIRPYDKKTPVEVRPALRYDDEKVYCGSKIDSGWWIFASDMEVKADPTKTISLCVKEPDGDHQCSENEETEFEVRIDESGVYQFSFWDEIPRFSTCEIRAT